MNTKTYLSDLGLIRLRINNCHPDWGAAGWRDPAAIERHVSSETGCPGAVYPFEFLRAGPGRSRI